MLLMLLQAIFGFFIITIRFKINLETKQIMINFICFYIEIYSIPINNEKNSKIKEASISFLYSTPTSIYQTREEKEKTERRRKIRKKSKRERLYKYRTHKNKHGSYIGQRASFFPPLSSSKIIVNQFLLISLSPFHLVILFLFFFYFLDLFIH